MAIFNLKLPEALSSPLEHGFELNLSKLNGWIDALPLTNTEMSSRALITVLAKLNRSKLDAVTRSHYLNTLSSVCGKLIDILRTHYQQAQLPLSKKCDEKFQTAVYIANEIAHGYQLMVEQLIEGKNGYTDNDVKTLLPLSIHLALRHLTSVLIDYYLAYSPEPPNLWSTIHQLYCIADSRGLSDNKLKSDSQDQYVSIAYTYKYLLLMSITNPHHLMYGELEHVNNYISQTALLCPLTRLQQDGTGTPAYVATLNSDNPPRFSRGRNILSKEFCRVLDIAPFVNKLQGQYNLMIKKDHEHSAGKLSLDKNNIETDSHATALRLEERLHRDMLQRVINTLQRKSERTFERSPLLGTLQMAIGLSSSHHRISEGAEFNPELAEVRIHTGKAAKAMTNVSLVPLEFEHWRGDETQQRLSQGINNPRVSNFTDDASALDIWRKVYTNKSSDPSMDDANADVRNFLSASPWTQKNISAGGMCLFTHAKQTLAVRVGDLVAYQNQSQEPWWIGILCWLRVHEDILETGVMHVHRSAYPVAVRAIFGTGCGSEYLRALFTEPTLHDSFNTLITPAGLFDSGTELVINRNQELHYVRLLDAVLTTKSISQYHYCVIDTPQIEAESIRRLKHLI